MSQRARKNKMNPVPIGQLKPIQEPTTLGESIVEEKAPKTELQQLTEMMERAGIEHKVTPTDTNVIVRIGGLYSYSLWTFSSDGLLKSQHQYESLE